MRTRLTRAAGVTVLGALMALASHGAQAAPPTPRPETSLLGIRLQSSFADVLRKFGQPNEIQVGQPTVSANALAQGGSSAQPGGMPGGMSGYPGMMPGGPPGMSGYPGMMPGGMGGYPGMMGQGGRRPGLPGFTGGKGEGGGFPTGQIPPGMGPMAGGPPGMSGYPGMMPGGPPGMSGYPGMMPGGMGGYPGLPGYNPGGLGAGGNTAAPSVGVETTWWYHFPKQGLHYSFLFNRQGHVVQIQAYGYNPSSKVPVARTAQGITLGAPLGQVIRRYGWSNDGENSGDYVVLRYGGPDQVAFQSLHNKIVGIVLGVVK